MPNTAPEQLNPQAIALSIVKHPILGVLLLKRNKKAHCGELWSFPGGKIEAPETAFMAAKRELQEETGLTAEYWQEITTYQHAYPDICLNFTLFSCCTSNISMLQAESPHQWVNIEKLHHYDMPDANKALLQAFLKHHHSSSVNKSISSD